MLCTVTGRNINELAKARKFARLYTSKKLKWLCSLGQTTGRPLTKSHVCRLVVVANSKQRDRLARQCARDGMVSHTLDHEIKEDSNKAARTVDGSLNRQRRWRNCWSRRSDLQIAGIR